MKKIFIIFFLSTVTALCEVPSAYNVLWNTPSMDSLDSMPLSGRKGAGANAWVQDGAIWLYLSHNGAYDEMGRLLKLGCLRITPQDRALLEGSNFSQELDLATGTIHIKAGEFSAKLWFAGQTLFIETSSVKANSLEVVFATWRDRKRNNIILDMGNAPCTIQPDQVQADDKGILWFHRNSDYPHNITNLARSQGIGPSGVYDPTSQRIFGGALAIDGGWSAPVVSTVSWQFWQGSAWTGHTPERLRHLIAVVLRAEEKGDTAKWSKDAKESLQPNAIAEAKTAELKLWQEFWSRSSVIINPQAKSEDPGWMIGRNYQLFRFMLASNRDGELPLLFNGGIFTTDNKPGRVKGNNNEGCPLVINGASSPDFRRWINCRFMMQNQRWLGWPTLAGGDQDLLKQSLAFYRDRANTAAARAKTLGAEGVVYPESLDIWGLCCVAPRPDSLCGAPHLTYHFSEMLEHAWMALQAHDVMGVSLTDDLPWIEGSVLFYDSYYQAQTLKRTGKKLTEDGKLVIYPSNGMEYAGGATNPIEVVCALKQITKALLRLPELSIEKRARFKEIESRLPEIPTGLRRGRLSILPAKSVEVEYNKWEPIEMFAYWPYRLVGITRPETLNLARDTWETVPPDRAKLCKQDFSWMANLANMAALAWPDKAKERAIWKMANNFAPQARFPAFFGPGHDWLPDHNWGGSGMVGVQEMLLAPEPGQNGKLNLFPAWPPEWDVKFKLHAPGKTIVEGVFQDGKLSSLKVTPESRAKDIINWMGKQPEYIPIPPPPVPMSQSKSVTVSSQFNKPGYDSTRAVDGDFGTRWASDSEARSGWLEVDLGEEKEIGRILIFEIDWQETREFALEIKQGDTWKEIARGTTIGKEKEIVITPIKARFVRLNVLKAQRPININEFQIFPPELKKGTGQ